MAVREKGVLGSNSADHPFFVTVGIPTFNRARTLSLCLTALEMCDYPKSAVRIVFVDNASSDGTQRILAEFREKHSTEYEKIIIVSKRTNIPQARNLCIKYAYGQFLLFLDSDVIFPKDGLWRMLEVLASRPHLAAVGFPYRSLANWGERVYFRSEPRTLHSALILHAGCTMYRRELFASVGLFDEARTILEDADLVARAHKAGYDVQIDPSREVIHLREWPGGATWEVALSIKTFLKLLATQHFDLLNSTRSGVGNDSTLLKAIRRLPVLTLTCYTRVLVSLSLLIFYTLLRAFHLPRTTGGWRLLNPTTSSLFGIPFASTVVKEIVETDLR